MTERCGYSVEFSRLLFKRPWRWPPGRRFSSQRLDGKNTAAWKPPPRRPKFLSCTIRLWLGKFPCRMGRPPGLILMACLVLFLPTSLSAQISPVERSALIELYNSTEGTQWREQEGWLGPPGTEGDWYGLEVQDGHVIKVDLSSNNLRGKLPREIGNLSELLWLNLSGRQRGSWVPVKNDLSGWITTWIGRLQKLEFLDLSSNSFSGPIPSTIAKLNRLQRLDLSDNKLQQIPAEIGSLPELRILDLGSNQFTQMPEEIGNLHSLEELSLNRTEFQTLPSSVGDLLNLRTLGLTGSRFKLLPSSIGNLSNLRTLHVGRNQLQNLPSSIGDLVNLVTLDVGSNQLTNLPEELGRLTQLQSLSVWSNPRLTLLPTTIGNLTQLQSLRLGRTTLTQIPPGVSQITTLESVDFSEGFYEELPPGVGNFRWARTLDLRDNHLTDLPDELANLTALESLDICENRLTTLPPVLVRIPNLSSLCFHKNPLQGPIPALIANFMFLETLDLSRFDFTGSIPPEISSMSWLKGLDLSGNQLSGEIPVHLTRLQNLGWLNLRGNQLTGEIPPQLASMANLGGLDPSYNDLSGGIPAELGSMPNLHELRLSGNELNGSIPAELGNIQKLFLDQNDLSGEIPPELGGVESLNLAENQLTGRIPPELGGIGERLILSHNLLSGEIPAELLQGGKLEHIGLDHNRLTGNLPGSRGRIRTLDLRSNQLRGRVPAEFGSGDFSYLDLSRNLLSGPLPDSLSQLRPYYLLLDWNALSSETPATDEFVKRNRPPHPFHKTQTIPPRDLRVERVTGTTARLSWTPIEFFFFEGGYEVYYSTDPDGPYQLYGRTEYKTKDSVTVTGLDSDTTYHFALRTVTESHEFTENIVTSEVSQQVSAKTSGPAEVYFPLLLSGTETLTGVALSSDTDVGISLQFEAFEPSGESLLSSSNPIQGVLLPRSQEVQLSRTLLGLEATDSAAGWIKLSADNSRFGGVFQIGSGARLDGGAAFGAAANRIYFTRVFDGSSLFRGQPATTLLSIVNPNPWPVQVTLTYVTPTKIGASVDSQEKLEKLTRDRTIPANGMILKPPRELFERDLSGGYIDVLVRSGGVGVAGLELIKFAETDTWLALPAQPQMQSRALYSAQAAMGPEIFTDVQLVNTTKHPREVTISFIGDSNSPPGKEFTFRLLEKASFSCNLQEILGLEQPSMILQGSLRIDADRPGLVGDVIFGDRQGLRYAAGLALQGPGIRSALLTHVVNTPGIYTALALFNPGEETAEVQLQAFSKNGLLIGNGQLVLSPGGRVSKTLSSLIPETRNQSGYLKLESTAPIAIQQLFGTADLKWLSATSPSRIQRAEVRLR